LWLKLGGDKGGGTFKMSFQVANVENPKSQQNTVVFNIFVAPDTFCNLKLSLDQYSEDVQQLSSLIWK
jgi:hypothetical protein